jgi:hypothetical protein
LEVSVHDYEIRILRADRSTHAVVEVMHISDHAAIRAAQKMAEARPFEVWRGLDCIYGRPSGPAVSQQPHVRRAGMI